jgi:hypothetical protein
LYEDNIKEDNICQVADRLAQFHSLKQIPMPKTNKWIDTKVNDYINQIKVIQQMDHQHVNAAQLEEWLNLDLFNEYQQLKLV